MSVHIWRQAQTQSTINSFYEEDFNILNPKKNDRGNTDGIFRMEFPLMQWMVAATYKVLGKHLIITRLWMFFIGCISVLGMYLLAKELFNNKAIGVLAAYTITFSPSFFYYTINPLPDNMALAFCILGIGLFIRWIRKPQLYLLLMSSFCLTISTLCKLPFILFYSIPGIFIIRELFIKKNTDLKQILILITTLIIPFIIPVIWYINVIPHWGGNGVTSGIFDNQITWNETGRILMDNLISILPELLLNYGSVLFFVAGFVFLFKQKKYKHPYFYMLFTISIAVSIYFFYEINMISNVHDYYLFPFFPLLFLIVSYGAGKMLGTQNKALVILSFTLLFSLPFFTELRMLSRWNESKPGVNKDLFDYKDELRTAVKKDILCIAGPDLSHFIMLYYIDKKGWCFDKPKPPIHQMISEGAQYLYLDVSKTEDTEYFKQYTDSLILKKGSIEVYQLIK